MQGGYLLCVRLNEITNCFIGLLFVLILKGFVLNFIDADQVDLLKLVQRRNNSLSKPLD